MQLVMVENQHQRSYGKKPMKAQNTINLGQISGEMKTWNTFILGSKGLWAEERLSLVFKARSTPAT